MRTFNLELTEEEVKVVGNSLLELPAKISINLINKINGQLNNQLKEGKDKKDEK